MCVCVGGGGGGGEGAVDVGMGRVVSPRSVSIHLKCTG